MRLQHRTLPFELRSARPDGSYFEGHAAVLNSIDEYGTIMARGAFDKHLDFFRTRGFLGGLNHDWDNPIGKPSKAEMDAKGLLVGGDVIDTAHGLDVRKLLKAGIVRSMSFGFEDLRREWLEKPSQVEDYWRSVGYEPTPEDRDRATRGALLFTEIRVFEASPVMVPGNTDAGITAVRGIKAGKGGSMQPISDCRIEQDGDKWRVVDADGKTVSEHDSEDEANSAMAAGRSGPLLPLQEHIVAVRAAVDEFCGRLEQLATLRAEAGRSVGPDKRAALLSMRDQIDHALAACQPRAGESKVAALRRELFELETSVLLAT